MPPNRQQSDLGRALQGLNVPTEFLELAEAEVRRLAEHFGDAVKNVQEQHPRITKAEVEALLTPVEGDGWSPEDEARLHDDWQQDPTRKPLLDGASKNEGSLWKTCTRVLRCVPTDIISIDFKLEYDVSRNRGANPSWSTSFCDGLRRLVTHPVFAGGDKSLLATVIQYAVICRTNDHRVWPVRNHTWDAFFDELGTVASTQDGTMSIAEIHKRARRNLKARDEHRQLPIWSKLFLQLEKEAWRKDTPPFLDDQPVRYLVRTADLANVERALDSTIANGYPSFGSAAMVNRVVESARKSDDPPTSADLRSLRDRAYLRERKKVALVQRREASGAQGHSGSNHGDGSGMSSRESHGASHSRGRRRSTSESDQSDRDGTRSGSSHMGGRDDDINMADYGGNNEDDEMENDAEQLAQPSWAERLAGRDVPPGHHELGQRTELLGNDGPAYPESRPEGRSEQPPKFSAARGKAERAYLFFLTCRQRIDTNVACLLACLGGLPERPQRILIRLGNLAAPDVSMVVVKPDVLDRHTTARIQEEAWGPGAALAQQGHLWAVLGLWERIRRLNNNFHRAVEVNLSHDILLSIDHAKEVFQRVGICEELYELQPGDDTLVDELSDQELWLVQRHLVRAWIDELVILRRRDFFRGSCEMLTTTNIAIDPVWAGLFSPNLLTPDRPTSKTCLSFALGFRRVDGLPLAVNLTALPRRLLREIAEEYGNEPDMLETIYQPLQRELEEQE